jgi:glutathione peroxidase
MMIYDYKVKTVEGHDVSLADYRGKVLLIVNTATGCGLTPQYEGLQKLYDKFKDEKFEILDFPSNQFFEQAPGTNEEIVDFCKLTYGTTFKTFSKIDVNGENTHELYKFLKKEAPKAMEDAASEGLYSKLSDLGFTTAADDIKWNFTKFLVDKKGNVLERFAPTFEPGRLEDKIKGLLH